MGSCLSNYGKVLPFKTLIESKIVLPDKTLIGSKIVLPDKTLIGSKIVLPNKTLIGSKIVLPDKSKSKNKNKYKKKSIPKPLKKLVWDTYIGESIGKSACFCCNHQQIRQIEFHCGHVLSEIDGGKLELDNLRPICAQCNLSMGKTNMIEYKRKYFKN